MSPSESSPYTDNFVSQEQIDTLLEGSNDYAFPDGVDPLGDIADFINTDDIDRLLGEDPEEDDFNGAAMEGEMSDEPFSEDEDLSMISMDDVQRVLSEGDDYDPPLEEETLDLEGALEPSEEAGNGDGDLISQDDINRLLKNSGVDAQDTGQEEIAEGFQISPEELDILVTDPPEKAPELRNDVVPDQEPPEVVEEALELEAPPGKKKRIVMAALFLSLAVVAGGCGWFFLAGSGAGDSPTVTSSPSVSGDDGMGNIPVEAGEPEVVSRLENFLIPAADGNSYAFVSTHIAITIRGVKKDPIKGYEPFYRKRIYDALAAKLGKISGEKPVEHELREQVRKTAGALLTEGVIDKVVLESYRLL